MFLFVLLGEWFEMMVYFVLIEFEGGDFVL